MRLQSRRRLSIVLGGGIGTLGRVAVADGVPAIAGWPLATLTVNLLGSFLLGFVLARLSRSAAAQTYSVPLLGIGVLGAFTTFSTFALELVLLSQEGRWPIAAGYAAVGIGFGLALAFIGMRLGGSP